MYLNLKLYILYLGNKYTIMVYRTRSYRFFFSGEEAPVHRICLCVMSKLVRVVTADQPKLVSYRA
jgi:hypothetical protein